MYAVSVGLVADTLFTVILSLVVTAFVLFAASFIIPAFKLTVKLPAANPFTVTVYLYPSVTAVGVLTAVTLPFVFDTAKLLVESV